MITSATTEVSAALPAGPTGVPHGGGREPRPLRPRSAIDLLLAQLAGIDCCATTTPVGPAEGLSREERMDRDRWRAARERERDAMRAWTQRDLAGPVIPLEGEAPARAVVAHRQPWFREKVVAGLQDQGVHVVAVLEDGADACGTVLAEQPEILLVEERLTSVSGLDVVRRVHEHAPDTFVGVQVVEASSIGELMNAGAGSAFTRQVGPADVVVELTHCLAEELP